MKLNTKEQYLFVCCNQQAMLSRHRYANATLSLLHIRARWRGLIVPEIILNYKEAFGKRKVVAK
ncbi:MAG TPA: hypothetical protein VFI29_17910 [Hanamia sp.]|nr:hypothetical protein [Hanamia sp.]